MYWQTLVQNTCWLYTPLSTMTLSLRNVAVKLGLSLVIASITGSWHKAKTLKLIETEGWSFRMVVIQTTVCCTLLRDVFHAPFFMLGGGGGKLFKDPYTILYVRLNFDWLFRKELVLGGFGFVFLCYAQSAWQLYQGDDCPEEVFKIISIAHNEICYMERIALSQIIKYGAGKVRQT